MKIAILHHANFPNIPTKIIVNIVFLCMLMQDNIWIFIHENADFEFVSIQNSL